MEPTPILTIVQARFGSSRLPGKATKPIQGRPMLAHVLERALAIGYPVWLATSEVDRDDAIADIGTAAGVSVFRGIEWDVLSRYAEIVRRTQAAIVIRLTGDCPLVCVDTAREVFGLFCGAGLGTIASNDTTTSGWPDGTDVEVMFGADLLDAAEHANDRADREHVTPWLRRARAHVVLPCAENWSHVKISVDSPEDYTRVKALIAKLPKGEFEWAVLRAGFAAMGWKVKEAA